MLITLDSNFLFVCADFLTFMCRDKDYTFLSPKIAGRVIWRYSTLLQNNKKRDKSWANTTLSGVLDGRRIECTNYNIRAAYKFYQENNVLEMN